MRVARPSAPAPREHAVGAVGRRWCRRPRVACAAIGPSSSFDPVDRGRWVGKRPPLVASPGSTTEISALTHWSSRARDPARRGRSDRRYRLMPTGARPYEVMIILDVGPGRGDDPGRRRTVAAAHRVAGCRARARRLVGQASARLRDPAPHGGLLRGLPGPVRARRRWTSCTGRSPLQTKSSVTRCCAFPRRSTGLRRLRAPRRSSS